MVEDKELIRKYAAERSETAFAELVRRHLNMVYGAALRQVNGDTHLAQDLAQAVFASLAARAATLQGATSIAGWLYTNTRFAAVKAVRGEARRREREQAVFSMNEMNSNTNEVWNEFGVKTQATFGPSETLVASGWRTADGKNGLIFVTPQMNPELEGVGVLSNQVLIAPHLIEVPDDVLDRLGMATFKGTTKWREPAGERARYLMASFPWYLMEKGVAVLGSEVEIGGTGGSVPQLFSRPIPHCFRAR